MLNFIHGKTIKNFDPLRVAQLETEMWKQYYEHNFLRLQILLYKLLKTQFQSNVVQTLLLAYRSSAAAYFFRKKDNKDQALKHLQHFYDRVNSISVERFDATLVAQAELDWWMAHRYRKSNARTSLLECLQDHMSKLYDIKRPSVANYAEQRVLAMDIRDKAAHQDKIEPDWSRIEHHLHDAYEQLSAAVNAKS